MRYSNLPDSFSPEQSPPPETTAAETAGATQATQAPEATRPPEQPPSAVPAALRRSITLRKEVITLFVMLGRLRASFGRAEAVHQARLDDFWRSPQRHLLMHYTCSAK